MFSIQGRFDGVDTFVASDVHLDVGAYLAFNDGKQERGFGTRDIVVNNEYHKVQGEYSTLKYAVGKHYYRYKGQLKNGIMFGLGYMRIYKKSNYELIGTYEGRFKNNRFDGEGRYVYIDKDMEFVGSYKNHAKWTGALKNINKTCSNIYKEGQRSKCNS